MDNKTLIGPFNQILTMDNLPPAGPISDDQLEIIHKGGIIINNEKIERVLTNEEFENTKRQLTNSPLKFRKMKDNAVLLPGFVDSHTHLCWAGDRINEYSQRLAGLSYEAIARKGGGILNTVNATRKASLKGLENNLIARSHALLDSGVTTCEVKSGYGLDFENEIKILNAINNVKIIDLVPTCLAAHVLPPEFTDMEQYIDFLIQDLLPEVKAQNLSNRVDIFIDDIAFSKSASSKYLKAAHTLGFKLVVHANQFNRGGAILAAENEALSVDHMEIAEEEDLKALQKAKVIVNVLPGSSVGLGLPFAPARKILDYGISLGISSDWNPGSAPMGNLLVLASLISVYEKLTVAETLSAITERAARILLLNDRGRIKAGLKADLVAFPCTQFGEILYRQGALKPFLIWKKGQLCKGNF